MPDCDNCSIETDIRYIRESIDEVKENTKNQWRYINKNELDITRIQTAIPIIIVFIVAILGLL